MFFEVMKEAVILSLVLKMGRDSVGAGISGRSLRLGCVRGGVPVMKCSLLDDG